MIRSVRPAIELRTKPCRCSELLGIGACGRLSSTAWVAVLGATGTPALAEESTEGSRERTVRDDDLGAELTDVASRCGLPVRDTIRAVAGVDIRITVGNVTQRARCRDRPRPVPGSGSPRYRASHTPTPSLTVHRYSFRVRKLKIRPHSVNGEAAVIADPDASGTESALSLDASAHIPHVLVFKCVYARALAR